MSDIVAEMHTAMGEYLVICSRNIWQIFNELTVTRYWTGNDTDLGFRTLLSCISAVMCPIEKKHRAVRDIMLTTILGPNFATVKSTLCTTIYLRQRGMLGLALAHPALLRKVVRVCRKLRFVEITADYQTNTMKWRMSPVEWWTGDIPIIEEIKTPAAPSFASKNRFDVLEYDDEVAECAALAEKTAGSIRITILKNIDDDRKMWSGGASR